MGISVRTIGLILVSAVAAVGLAGCANKNGPLIEPVEDVNAKTDGWGLRKLDPSEYPDMKLAWMDKAGLEQAVDKSLQFLSAGSSAQWYPSKNPGDTITHDQVQATLVEIKEMIRRNVSPADFEKAVQSRYDVYTSVGYNNKGDVWFTGYFTPRYEGSLVQTGAYRYPIYKRPVDLSSNPITGEVVGSYPTRQELMSSGRLRGQELLWFKKPLEPFMIQVQGSAQVVLPDGTKVYVGYAGSNGREHKGLGTQLRDAGKIDPKHVSLPSVIAYFDAHPQELDQYVLKDDRFTFQKIYTEAEIREWPTGSLGVRVTTDRTIATDKSIFPRASLAFIDVPKPSLSGTLLPYQGFVLDQDAGGGIKAAGRADIYMGFGDDAGKRAGEEFAQGRMYYVFLKPEYVSSVMGASATARPATGAAPGGATRRGGTRPAGGEMFPGAVGPR
jgi:membrane-bound lytic murein transglycosylase A